MPADVARRMGGEVVIAVDVMGGFEDGVLFQSLGGHRLVPGRLLHIAADAQRTLSIMRKPDASHPSPSSSLSPDR